MAIENTTPAANTTPATNVASQNKVDPAKTLVSTQAVPFADLIKNTIQKNYTIIGDASKFTPIDTSVTDDYQNYVKKLTENISYKVDVTNIKDQAVDNFGLGKDTPFTATNENGKTFIEFEAPRVAVPTLTQQFKDLIVKDKDLSGEVKALDLLTKSKDYFNTDQKFNDSFWGKYLQESQDKPNYLVSTEGDKRGQDIANSILPISTNKIGSDEYRNKFIAQNPNDLIKNSLGDLYAIPNVTNENFESFKTQAIKQQKLTGIDYAQIVPSQGLTPFDFAMRNGLVTQASKEMGREASQDDFISATKQLTSGRADEKDFVVNKLFKPELATNAKKIIQDRTDPEKQVEEIVNNPGFYMSKGVSGGYFNTALEGTGQTITEQPLLGVPVRYANNIFKNAKEVIATGVGNIEKDDIGLGVLGPLGLGVAMITSKDGGVLNENKVKEKLKTEPLKGDTFLQRFENLTTLRGEVSQEVYNQGAESFLGGKEGQIFGQKVTAAELGGFGKGFVMSSADIALTAALSGGAGVLASGGRVAQTLAPIYKLATSYPVITTLSADYSGMSTDEKSTNALKTLAISYASQVGNNLIASGIEKGFSALMGKALSSTNKAISNNGLIKNIFGNPENFTAIKNGLSKLNNVGTLTRNVLNGTGVAALDATVDTGLSFGIGTLIDSLQAGKFKPDTEQLSLENLGNEFAFSMVYGFAPGLLRKPEVRSELVKELQNIPATTNYTPASLTDLANIVNQNIEEKNTNIKPSVNPREVVEQAIGSKFNIEDVEKGLQSFNLKKINSEEALKDGKTSNAQKTIIKNLVNQTSDKTNVADVYYFDATINTSNGPVPVDGYFSVGIKNGEVNILSEAKLTEKSVFDKVVEDDEKLNQFQRIVTSKNFNNYINANEFVIAEVNNKNAFLYKDDNTFKDLNGNTVAGAKTIETLDRKQFLQRAFQDVADLISETSSISKETKQELDRKFYQDPEAFVKDLLPILEGDNQIKADVEDQLNLLSQKDDKKSYTKLSKKLGSDANADKYLLGRAVEQVLQGNKSILAVSLLMESSDSANNQAYEYYLENKDKVEPKTEKVTTKKVKETTQISSEPTVEAEPKKKTVKLKEIKKVETKPQEVTKMVDINIDDFEPKETKPAPAKTKLKKVETPKEKTNKIKEAKPAKKEVVKKVNATKTIEKAIEDVIKQSEEWVDIDIDYAAAQNLSTRYGVEIPLETLTDVKNFKEAYTAAEEDLAGLQRMTKDKTFGFAREVTNLKKEDNVSRVDEISGELASKFPEYFNTGMKPDEITDKVESIYNSIKEKKKAIQDLLKTAIEYQYNTDSEFKTTWDSLDKKTVPQTFIDKYGEDILNPVKYFEVRWRENSTPSETVAGAITTINGQKAILVVANLLNPSVTDKTSSLITLAHEAAHAFVSTLKPKEKIAFLRSVKAFNDKLNSGETLTEKDWYDAEEIAVEALARELVAQEVYKQEQAAKEAKSIWGKFKAFLAKMVQGVKDLFGNKKQDFPQSLRDFADNFISKNEVDVESNLKNLKDFNTWLSSEVKDIPKESIDKFREGETRKLYQLERDGILNKDEYKDGLELIMKLYSPKAYQRYVLERGDLSNMNSIEVNDLYDKFKTGEKNLSGKGYRADRIFADPKIIKTNEALIRAGVLEPFRNFRSGNAVSVPRRPDLIAVNSGKAHHVVVSMDFAKDQGIIEQNFKPFDKWRLIGASSKSEVRNNLQNKVKFRESDKPQDFIRQGENLEQTDRIRETELVARERFNIPKLEKISSGGSDRDVYNIGGKYVLKVAKTARGLAQNRMGTDSYLQGESLLPETIESGLNYIVVEKVSPPDTNTKKLVNAFKKINTAFGRNLGRTSSDVANDFIQVANDLGYEDLMNVVADYGDILFNDLTAIRNWGTKDGEPVLLDEGSFITVDTLNSYKGKTNLSDEDFREIYNKSKQVKKQFGDTDSATMYRDSTQSPYAFENQDNLRYLDEAYDDLRSKITNKGIAVNEVPTLTKDMVTSGRFRELTPVEKQDIVFSPKKDGTPNTYMEQMGQRKGVDFGSNINRLLNFIANPKANPDRVKQSVASLKTNPLFENKSLKELQTIGGKIFDTYIRNKENIKLKGEEWIQFVEGTKAFDTRVKKEEKATQKAKEELDLIKTKIDAGIKVQEELKDIKNTSKEDKGLIKSFVENLTGLTKSNIDLLDGEIKKAVKQLGLGLSEETNIYIKANVQAVEKVREQKERLLSLLKRINKTGNKGKKNIEDLVFAMAEKDGVGPDLANKLTYDKVYDITDNITETFTRKFNPTNRSDELQLQKLQSLADEYKKTGKFPDPSKPVIALEPVDAETYRETVLRYPKYLKATVEKFKAGKYTETELQLAKEVKDWIRRSGEIRFETNIISNKIKNFVPQNITGSAGRQTYNDSLATTTQLDLVGRQMSTQEFKGAGDAKNFIKGKELSENLLSEMLADEKLLQKQYILTNLLDSGVIIDENTFNTITQRANELKLKETRTEEEKIELANLESQLDTYNASIKTTVLGRLLMPANIKDTLFLTGVTPTQADNSTGVTLNALVAGTKFNQFLNNLTRYPYIGPVLATFGNTVALYNNLIFTGAGSVVVNATQIGANIPARLAFNFSGRFLSDLTEVGSIVSGEKSSRAINLLLATREAFSKNYKDLDDILGDLMGGAGNLDQLAGGFTPVTYFSNEGLGVPLNLGLTAQAKFINGISGLFTTINSTMIGTFSRFANRLRVVAYLLDKGVDPKKATLEQYAQAIDKLNKAGDFTDMGDLTTPTSFKIFKKALVTTSALSGSPVVLAINWVGAYLNKWTKIQTSLYNGVKKFNESKTTKERQEATDQVIDALARNMEMVAVGGVMVLALKAIFGLLGQQPEEQKEEKATATSGSANRLWYEKDAGLQVFFNKDTGNTTIINSDEFIDSPYTSFNYLKDLISGDNNFKTQKTQTEEVAGRIGVLLKFPESIAKTISPSGTEFESRYADGAEGLIGNIAPNLLALTPFGEQFVQPKTTKNSGVDRKKAEEKEVQYSLPERILKNLFKGQVIDLEAYRTNILKSEQNIDQKLIDLEKDLSAGKIDQTQYNAEVKKVKDLAQANNLKVGTTSGAPSSSGGRISRSSSSSGAGTKLKASTVKVRKIKAAKRPKIKKLASIKPRKSASIKLPKIRVKSISGGSINSARGGVKKVSVPRVSGGRSVRVKSARAVKIKAPKLVTTYRNLPQAKGI